MNQILTQKKDKISKNEYASIHHWIQQNYGRANRCESKTCIGKSNKFEWALLHGKDYEKNVKNFMQMCMSCHRKYDVTPETIKKWKQMALKRTHCKKGHEYTPENTVIKNCIDKNRKPYTSRYCKTCIRIKYKRLYQAIKFKESLSTLIEQK